MSGHRLPSRLVAAWALSFVSLPAIAAAQYAPSPQPYARPGQYSPYPPPGPYSRPAQSPYAQPLPYPAQPYSAPGYQQLSGSPDHGLLSDRTHTWPVLRFSGGVSGVLADGVELRPAFDLDVVAGARIALRRRLFLMAEAGYSMSSDATYGGHFATLGAGPAVYLHRFVTVGWVPRVVIGETGLGFGIGLRNSVIVPILFHVINVEIGHQWLVTEGRDVHEMRAQLGIDVGGVAYLLAWQIAGSIR